MKSLIVLFSALFSIICFADTKLASNADSSCRQNPKDPMDKGWRLTDNDVKFPRQCLDTSSIRPIVIVEKTAQHVRFENFYDQGQYWTAEWDTSDQPEIHYAGVHFSTGVPFVVAGHTELRFLFTKGLSLVSQETGAQEIINDVIVSWHGGLPVGVAYDVFTGVDPNYALAGRVVSRASRYAEEINPDGSHLQVDEYKLAMTPEQATLVFAHSLGYIDSLALKTFYLTLLTNCTTQLFNIVDEVLMQTDPETYPYVEPYRTLPIPDPVLGPAHNGLIRRFLIGPNDPPLPQD